MNSSQPLRLQSVQLPAPPAAILKAVREERQKRNIERIRARCEALSGFIQEAWSVVEPGSRYVHGWHIDAICEHLEAITFGKLLELGAENRLLINIPPGTMKSLIVSVFWPAWEWGPVGRPEMRYLTTSYSEAYVIRDSRRMRDLVASEWYQSLWPEVRLIRSGEKSFANTRTGFREGMPFASLTGGRGHRVIIDDPHSTEMAESDADRARTTRIFRESVPSRLVEPDTSAIVVVMQRLHANDVSGTALSLNLGYQHLMLPMEFEPDRRCHTVIGFSDPRQSEGELLFPERFSRAVVDRDKVPMGSFAVAGQFQQRPVPREGALFKRAWFEGKVISAAPGGTRWVRHWDLAATKEGTGARTAGVKLGRAPDGRFIVGNAIATREDGPEVRRLIKATAEMDGPDVEVAFPQDPGQAGKVQKSDMVSMLAGFRVHAEPETGSKQTRAEPFAAQCAAGNVYIVEGAWNEAYLDELVNFPGGSLKDQVDASSGAFGRLARAGDVFRMSLVDIEVPPFLIPEFWPKAYAVDVGPDTVSVIWGAWDPSVNALHLYAEMRGGNALPSTHAAAIEARGGWIRGVIAPRQHGRSKDDGDQILSAFRGQGMSLSPVEDAIEAGTEHINQEVETGQIKVFSTLGHLKASYTMYRRDDRGRLPATDGMINAMRLLVMHGRRVAQTRPVDHANTSAAVPIGDSHAGY